jgi:hypothetical protein
MVTTANADLLQFGFDVDNPGPFLASTGGVINYEIWVQFSDDDGDGPDTQGLVGFSGNLLTDTGLAPTVDFAYTSLYPTFPSSAPKITDPLWEGTGKSTKQTGGFGMGFFTTLGTPTGDDIFGPSPNGPLTWDADVSSNAGLQPYAMANVGYGSPTTAVDSGGNAFSPFYGTGPRAKWYMLQGTIGIPHTVGTYHVTWDVEGANVISNGDFAGLPATDLNVDDTNGYGESVTRTGSFADGSFWFIVTPEPATLSALLFAGAGFVMRRRR